MYCRNCGKEMNENAAVCTACGVNKGVGKKFCPNCGCETNENQSVCLKCGVSLGKSKNSSSGSSGTDGFYRTKDGKLIAGVCAGLGKKFNTSPWVFRILFILFGCSFIGIIAYIAAAAIWKDEDEV